PARVLRFLQDGERVKPQKDAVEDTAKAAAPAAAP
ncbi:MAG: hypothetical protein RL030_1721, partial [Pseudomonadota bacterium]